MNDPLIVGEATAGKIDRPGVYAIDADAYHADPCRAPSLSASVAAVLLDFSPRHAWTRHPRLNPAYQPETSREFDLGTACHALMLGDERRFKIIDADSYRTKAAQQEREAAYEAGQVPLLTAQYERAVATVKAGREQLEHHEAAGAFVNGEPERTLIWREGDAWCRARLDWLPAVSHVFYDYKTTAGSANPERWGQRQMYDIGADVQAAFYRRGIHAVLGIEAPRFRFVVQEVEPPYALSVIELSPAALDLAERRVKEALRLWSACMASGRWPGYPARVAHVEPPPWLELRWSEREARREHPEGDALAQMMNWQSPAGA